MRSVACGDRERVCGDLHDARFCESIVVALDGGDCASVGLIVGKPFCFISTASCVHTTYALKDKDCVVREYTPVREWYACSPGTPTFRF
jgi:hypothetical protein